LNNSTKNLFFFLLAVVSAASVFCIGNFDIFSNHYIINDDVRQQIFWMERWRDPGLFQNDFLTRYAETYVPAGVKLIYRMASFWFEPVVFSNILTAILFVLTAGLWFAWGRCFGDDLTAFLVVVVFLLFSGFEAQIAGGLSRGFVFPLLIAYCLCISQGKLFLASVVLLIQSLFNPYVFLLCLFSHALVTAIRFGPELPPSGYQILDKMLAFIFQSRFVAFFNFGDDSSGGVNPSGESKRSVFKIFKTILIVNIPVIIGLIYTLFNVIGYQSSVGHLISWKEMIGKSEYTEFGRYQLFPVPSFLYELVRPWIFNLSFPYWGPIAGWLMALATVGVFFYAARNYKPVIKWKGLRGLFLILPASLFLYILARLFLVKLFVPRRYIYYTLSLIYCIGFAVALRIVLDGIRSRRIKLFCIISALLAFACIKGRHVEFIDFSEHHNLYKFFGTTAKNSLVAGWPELMDNVTTFGRRPVFVNYELSHTWVEPYWSEVKKRTFDLFRAYYSSSPDEIKRFFKTNHIRYFVVRSEDFERSRFNNSPPYFEPFNGYIWYLMNSSPHFAILDKSVFPPVFEENGIRVLQFE
jgi:hypothetical protein